MWLRNTKNNTFYPYHELMAKHYGMEIVYENPFVEKETLAELMAEELPVEEVVKKVYKEKVSTLKKPLKAKTKVANPRGKR